MTIGILLIFLPTILYIGWLGFSGLMRVGWLDMIKHRWSLFRNGKGDRNADVYSLILAHIDKKPDDWMFKDNYARFPKEGNAYKVVVQKSSNDSSKLGISIDYVDGGAFFTLYGYYEKCFREVINKAFTNHLTQKTIDELWDKDRQLLLSSNVNLSNINKNSVYATIEERFQSIEEL